MDPLLIACLAVLGGVFWFGLAAGPSRRRNAGARLFGEKRYAEAADAFRALLSGRLPAGAEADTRRRLADTLDILGHTEEAAQERERAGAVAMGAAKDPTALATYGDLLKRQHRHDEACEMYARALRRMSSLPSPGRAQVMAKMSLAHYNAGRPEETLR